MNTSLSIHCNAGPLNSSCLGPQVFFVVFFFWGRTWCHCQLQFPINIFAHLEYLRLYGLLGTSGQEEQYFQITPLPERVRESLRASGMMLSVALPCSSLILQSPHQDNKCIAPPHWISERSKDYVFCKCQTRRLSAPVDHAVLVSDDVKQVRNYYIEWFITQLWIGVTIKQFTSRYFFFL